MGAAVVAATVLAVAWILGLRFLEHHARWGQSKIAGHPIRFVEPALDSPEIRADLMRAVSIIDSLAPDCDYMIEVVVAGGVRTPSVPMGKFKDGSLVGGSWRSTRVLPVTPLLRIAVVTEGPRAGAYLIHEVLRHILSHLVVGHADADHVWEPGEKLEHMAAKRWEAYLREIGGR